MRSHDVSKSMMAAVLITLASTTTAAAAPFLNNCKPNPNCGSAGKPCFQTISQSDPNIVLRGDETFSSPAIGKSAIRVRICTSVDSVCEQATPDQRLNVLVFNMSGDPIYTESLAQKVGVLDTGAYTEIGPHAYLGVSCFYDDEPCRIAWQHCRVESPQMLKKSGGKLTIKSRAPQGRGAFIGR